MNHKDFLNLWAQSPWTQSGREAGQVSSRRQGKTAGLGEQFDAVRGAAERRKRHFLKKQESKMDNQHRKIEGYRELSKDEIDLMNDIKIMGRTLGNLVDRVRMNPDTDNRWVAIGGTDLQKGLMALTRAVAKPEFF